MGYDGPERRRRWTRREIIDRGVTFLAVCLAGWAIWGVQTQSNETDELSKENARRISETERLTRGNAQLTRQIQVERRQNVFRNCQDINDRHDNTIRQLDRLLTRRVREAPTQAERDRLRLSRASTVLLIEALVPKRDCAALARQQVSSNKP